MDDDGSSEAPGGGIESKAEGGLERLPTDQLLAGRYQLERELGRGAMGVVYVARDLQLLGADSTRVVIKVLQDEALRDPYTKKKFFQEFESLTRVNHPNVVKVLGRGSLPEGSPFFAMEFVDGKSLRSAISPDGMNLLRAADIIKQIGNGLTAVHERGILHCDLKPDNIMLQMMDDLDVVKLIDFGVAKVKDSVVAYGGTTKMLGTLNYASPEHFSANLSPLSDVYCFGLIAYEMVTGRRAFNPGNEAHMCFLQNEGVKVNPRDLRPELSVGAQEAILKALSRDPQNRFARAREFGEALATALSTSSPAWMPTPSSVEGSEETRETIRRAPALHIAYVLYIEIVDYAALPIDLQIEALRQLEQIVRASLSVNDADDKDFVLVSSGEGLAVVFLSDPTGPIRTASDVASETRKHPELKYRMGIHSGPAYVTTGSDARKSVAGGCVPTTKCIAAYGDAGHILLSASVADVLSQFSSWAPHMKDLGEQPITQGLRVRLHNFSTGELGNARRPGRCLKAEVPTSPAPAPVSGTPPLAQGGGPDTPDGAIAGRCDDGARQVLTEVMSLVRKCGAREITTSHLFAALVSGKDPYLRKALIRKGVSPEKLAALLEKLLTKLPASRPLNTGSDVGPARFSRNAKAILVLSMEIAASERRQGLSELDLVKGLIRHPGSGIRELLRVLGVSLADLDPESPRPTSTHSSPKIQIGPLREENCTPELWASLLETARSRGGLTTADLLAGPFAPQLARFGAQSGTAAGTRPLSRHDAPGAIECSRNVIQIFTRALATAGTKVIGASNLLKAFIDGAGSAGEAIRAHGIKLEWLTSELFVDRRLDLDRLPQAEREVIQLAFNLTRYRNDALVSRDHLLYALLSSTRGCLVVSLSHHHKDAAHLARLLRASMGDSQPAGRSLALVLTDMESELVDVLCRAEDLARRALPVGDEHLVQALVSVGVAGPTYQLLENNGVVLERLVPSAR